LLLKISRESGLNNELLFLVLHTVFKNFFGINTHKDALDIRDQVFDRSEHLLTEIIGIMPSRI